MENVNQNLGVDILFDDSENFEPSLAGCCCCCTASTSETDSE